MAISFRLRIMAIVIVVAVLPLGLLGLWLTRATARSGEELLRERIDDALRETVAQAAAAWTTRTSELLDLAEREEVQAALRPARARLADTEDGSWATMIPIGEGLEATHPHVQQLELVSIDGAVLWRWADLSPARPPEPGIVLEVDVHDGALGARMGRLRAKLSPSGILGPATTRSAGVTVGAFDPASGASLLPLPLDPALLAQQRFTLAGEEWLVVRRALAAPAVQLAAAAPLTPYTRPFDRVARTGTLLLLVVATTGVGLALLLTGYLTRSLGNLARAAEAVAGGDLDQRIEVSGRDEVSRVARAFNTMTESLRRTMGELADKRALAAVGEFAASLAHEIRNPLTSVQLDLQMVEERLPAGDAVARATQARALAEIRRLDRTVSGALRATRSGRMIEERVELGAVIRAAAHAAAPVFAASGATISLTGVGSGPHASGDAGALEQVVLNLLINAAQAAPRGRIDVSLGAEDGRAVILVRDDGTGISADALERVFDPLFTTRRDGAGLGLPIARRLIEAHGGTISLHSVPGVGTTARVTLPMA